MGSRTSKPLRRVDNLITSSASHSFSRCSSELTVVAICTLGRRSEGAKRHSSRDLGYHHCRKTAPLSLALSQTVRGGQQEAAATFPGGSARPPPPGVVQRDAHSLGVFGWARSVAVARSSAASCRAPHRRRATHWHTALRPSPHGRHRGAAWPLPRAEFPLRPPSATLHNAGAGHWRGAGHRRRKRSVE